MTGNKTILFQPRRMQRGDNPFIRGLEIDRLAANDCAARRADDAQPSTAGSVFARPDPAGGRGLDERSIIMDHDQDDFEAVRKRGQRQTLTLIAIILAAGAAIALAVHFLSP